MWTLEQLTGHVFIVLTGCSAVAGRSPPANSRSKMKFNNGLEHIHGTHVKITNGFIKRSEEQSNIGTHLRNYCCSENVTMHFVCLSTLSHKQHCFRFKKALNVKCVFWFYLQLCLKKSHSKQNSSIYYHICTQVFTKCPLLLSDFNETWISWHFSNSSQVSSFIKIRPLGAELFPADRQSWRS